MNSRQNFETVMKTNDKLNPITKLFFENMFENNFSILLTPSSMTKNTDLVLCINALKIL